MTTLSHAALRKCAVFFQDLYTLRTWDDLTTHIINTIPSLISTDICSYNDMSAHRRFAAYRGWPERHPTIPDAQAILGRFTHQHPVVAYVERTKDLATRKITDFVSQRQFRTTDLYNEFYRPLQLPYNMGTCIAVTQDSVLGIGLNRIKRDFTDHDLIVLDLIRPHLMQAYDNARVVSTMQEELTAMRQAMDEMDCAILSVSDSGRINWGTPRANTLIEIYGLREHRHTEYLTEWLHRWFKQQLTELNSHSEVPPPRTPLSISHGDYSLSIRLLKNGEHHLLFIDERRPKSALALLNELGLSPRETEILSWIAQGKTNPEIGTILGISPRTVQKHAERIYSRLGVENRHAAMRVALDAMQRGRWGNRL